MRGRALLVVLLLVVVPVAGCLGAPPPRGIVEVGSTSPCGPGAGTGRCTWVRVGAVVPVDVPYEGALAGLRELGFAFEHANSGDAHRDAIEDGAWMRPAASGVGVEAARVVAAGKGTATAWLLELTVARSPLDVAAGGWVAAGPAAERRLAAAAEEATSAAFAASAAEFENATAWPVGEPRGVGVIEVARREAACAGGESCRYAWLDASGGVRYAGAFPDDEDAAAIAALGFAPTAHGSPPRYWRAAAAAEGGVVVDLALIALRGPAGADWELRVTLTRPESALADADFVPWEARGSLAASVAPTVTALVAAFEDATGLRHVLGPEYRILEYAERPAAPAP